MNIREGLKRGFLVTIILQIGATVITACSEIRAAPAPTSPFLEHADELHPSRTDRAPWDDVWSINPGHIMVKTDEIRTVYVAPVNTQYLNMVKNKDGQYVLGYKLDPDDIESIADLFQQSLMDSIKNNPDTNLRLVGDRSQAMLILEPALIQLVPTSILTNSIADTVGLIIPGSKAVEEAASVGVQAGGGSLAAGTIAMEFKIIDGKTGTVIAEAKDRENDSASILPNYRDFEEFGWSRQTVRDWSQEFAQVFSANATTKVGAASDISVAPW